MRSNRRQLNSSKTEVMWCATSRRHHLLSASALSVDGVMVDPVTFVRDLGIYIDADLSTRTHVQWTVSCCFAVLHQLRQIRRLIPPATFQTLVVAWVLSRLDYDNGVLIGLPIYLVRRLQSVLNMSAQMIFQLRRSDHILLIRLLVYTGCASRNASTWDCITLLGSARPCVWFAGSASSALCQHRSPGRATIQTVNYWQ